MAGAAPVLTQITSLLLPKCHYPHIPPMDGAFYKFTQTNFINSKKKKSELFRNDSGKPRRYGEPAKAPKFQAKWNQSTHS